MNKSWLSGLSNVEPPKRKAHGPVRGSCPGHDSLLWASGLQGEKVPPVWAHTSANENLLSVSHRNSFTAHSGRKKTLFCFTVKFTQDDRRSWKISAFTDMMDGFRGRQRRKETERGAQWWLPCQFITRELLLTVWIRVWIRVQQLLWLRLFSWCTSYEYTATSHPQLSSWLFGSFSPVEATGGELYFHPSPSNRWVSSRDRPHLIKNNYKQTKHGHPNL